MSETDSKRPAARLGKYSLVAEIARGGMGVIYLAQAQGKLNFKKLVVVKELKPELAEDEKFREMFLDEARLAARLNHRNIVQTTEVDQDGERYFFVMEYLEGRTLHDVARLKGERALSTANILRIICDVLAGLHYAHELADYDGTPLNIVHRDVSPRNVFLTYDGQVKVLDFGVAKAAGRDQETEAGELKGRVPYMAPEHVGEAKIDRRVDIFSAGVLLREALVGKRLWQGFNEIEILRELLQKRIPPLPDDLDLADEAKDIIHKSMAPDRDERYRTAHEMRSALERYVARIDQSGSFAKAGEHISKEFAKHRAHVQALIEEHVARAESLPPEAEEVALPTLPLSAPELAAADGSSPSKASGVAQAQVVQDPAELPKKSSPSSPTIAANPSASGAFSLPAPSSSSDAVAAAGATPTATKSPAVVKDISIPPPPPKSPVAMYVMLGIAFLAVVAGLTALLLKTGEPPKVTNRPATTETTSIPTPTGRPTHSPAASASAEPDEYVEVTVHASPAVARLWIDNTSVGEGPYTTRYKRGTQHVVRASAPGYVTKSETMNVTATASMNIVLEKEAGAVPPVIVRPHPTGGGGTRVTPPAPTPEPTPPPPTNTRGVDPKSPYEK